MSYNKKILLLILPLTALFVALILIPVLSLEITYEEVSFADFRCDISAGLEHNRYDRDGWTGLFAQTPGGSRWTYAVAKPRDSATPLRAHLKQMRKPGVLELTDMLIFAVEARGKNRRRYIYLLQSRDRVIWLETGSSSSTLIQIKDMADRMLATLADGSGNRLIEDSEEITARTTRYVIPRYSQSIQFFILLMVGIMALVYLIMLVVFHFSALPPREPATDGLFLIRPVTIKLSMKPLGQQMFDGLLQARNGAVDVYSFRKKRFSLDFSELTRREQVRIGKTWLLKQPYLRLTYPEGKKVAFPGRKRPLPITRITLYVNAAQIRDLVRIPDFPFQDELVFHPLLRG